jgi:hypothetical protein
VILSSLILAVAEPPRMQIRELTAEAVMGNCVLGGREFVNGRARTKTKSWFWNTGEKRWESPDLGSDLTTEFNTLETVEDGVSQKQIICIVTSSTSSSNVTKGLRKYLPKPESQDKDAGSATWLLTANEIKTIIRLSAINKSQSMIIVAQYPGQSSGVNAEPLEQ